MTNEATNVNGIPGFAYQPDPKIYLNISGISRHVKVTLHDEGDDGTAVWRAEILGEEDRYVEGLTTDTIWNVLDKVANAYDE